jgi:hypothetical protein
VPLVARGLLIALSIRRCEDGRKLSVAVDRLTVRTP